MKKCLDCADGVFARGYCRKHYQARRRDGSLQVVNVQKIGSCQAEGCSALIFARGYCTRHYHLTSHPLKGIWAVLRNRDEGMYPQAWDRFEAFLADVGERPGDRYQLRRIRAGEVWSKDNFKWLAPVRKDKYGDYYSKEQRAEYSRDWHLQKKFQISTSEFNSILEVQGGGCAICSDALGKIHHKTGNPISLHMDHDHETGDRRGILCNECNRGIGLLGDDPSRLRAAADYLDKHRSSLACE